MPINSSVGIFGSVGANGKNQHNDVVAIQQRLNDLMHPPRVPLVVDGISGRKTRRMIRDFQKCVCHFNRPDGRVDPVGKTILALNDPGSEGKWAQMSIPEESSQGGGSGGGQSDSDLPKTLDEAVDATIKHIKKEQNMTPGEEAVMRGLLTKIFKGQKGGYTDFGPMGIVTKKQANDMFKSGVTIFKCARIACALGAANATLVTVGAVLSMLAPILMVVGFAIALQKAMQAGGRVYQAVGTSYMTVAWANGDWRPIGCQLVIQNNKSWPEELRMHENEMETYWREGQRSAVKALEDYCSQIAPRAGLSSAETQKALKAILCTIDKKMLARSILSDLAKRLKESGDMNVANNVLLLSDRVNYPH